MTRRATVLALLLVAVAVALALVARRGADEPVLPPVDLARVDSAPTQSRTPGVILTVTPHTVDLDGSAVLADPRRAVEPLPHARSRYDLRGIVDGDEAERLRGQLELLFELADLTHEKSSHSERALVRLRVAGDVRLGDLQKVMIPAIRAGHFLFEFEVATDAGVGHLTLLPYTFCACTLPPTPSWCAVPKLSIAPGGVTLIAQPDLTPPIGCHKALPRMGEPQPAFAADVDWRDRVIAGPAGGCPSAQVGAGGLDTAALARRLAAVRRAAPGCGWASVGGSDQVTWSVVAPTLAALFAEFGEVRVMFSFEPEPKPLPAGACEDALPLAELTHRPDDASPLRLGRRGCSE